MRIAQFLIFVTPWHSSTTGARRPTLSQRCRAICTASAKSHAVPGWLEVVSVLFTPCMFFFNQFWWRGAVTRDQKKINTKMNLTYKSFKSKLLWIYLLSMEIKNLLICYWTWLVTDPFVDTLSPSCKGLPCWAFVKSEIIGKWQIMKWMLNLYVW